MKFKKKILRHLKKALFYRLVTIVVTFFFLWFIYKDPQKAIIAAIGTEVVIHTVIYIAFECWWSKVR